MKPLLTGIPEENPRWSDLEDLALLRARLVLLDEGVFIEVADDHNQPPTPSEQFRSISRRWNSYPTKIGRVVWCELEFQPYELTPNGLPKREPSPITAPTPAHTNYESPVLSGCHSHLPFGSGYSHTQACPHRPAQPQGACYCRDCPG